MKKQRRTVRIARAAALLALLVGFQAASVPLGKLVTGSFVNLLLAVAGALCGLVPGLIVSIASPKLAKLLGIGPLWELIPFIAAGNAVFSAVWAIFGKHSYTTKKPGISNIAACLTAAPAKFLVLFLGVAKFAIPVLLNLPAAQAEALAGLFSFHQLLTAFIGGGIAAAVLPLLKTALHRTHERVK